MPRVDIWIRNEDWEKWKAIKNKPEWLHEHLNGGLVTYVQEGKTVTVQVPIRRKSQIMPPPPKCEICGDYHFYTDPNYDCNKRPIEPTVTPPEEVL